MDKTTNNVKKTYTLPIVKMSQEGNNLFDARYLLKDKNLGKEQDMSPTLDRDLCQSESISDLAKDHSKA